MFSRGISAPCLSTDFDDLGSTSSEESSQEDLSEFFSLEALKKGAVNGIDTSRRESYLSPQDFRKTFKVSKEEFARLPKWKQEQQKRNSGLF